MTIYEGNFICLYVDHFTDYDFITNSTVIMEIYNSTYPLADGDPGSVSAATATITTGR
jgi:hypothetical protein